MSNDAIFYKVTWMHLYKRFNDNFRSHIANYMGIIQNQAQSCPVAKHEKDLLSWSLLKTSTAVLLQRPYQTTVKMKTGSGDIREDKMNIKTGGLKSLAGFKDPLPPLLFMQVNRFHLTSLSQLDNLASFNQLTTGNKSAAHSFLL